MLESSVRFLDLHGQYNHARNVANSVARSMNFTGERLQTEEIVDEYPVGRIKELSVGILAGISEAHYEYRIYHMWGQAL